ncbi:MAG: hypothetical protein ACMVY4_20665 [Minwuia sp.]|uniref:hypothetical protein n=1 Tax=Minwuia sp. TaxID=2493630 RepID=UPI003A862E1D
MFVGSMVMFTGGAVEGALARHRIGRLEVFAGAALLETAGHDRRIRIDLDQLRVQVGIGLHDVLDGGEHQLNSSNSRSRSSIHRHGPGRRLSIGAIRRQLLTART